MKTNYLQNIDQYMLTGKVRDVLFTKNLTVTPNVLKCDIRSESDPDQICRMDLWSENGSYVLTPYDGVVLDALITLWKAGIKSPKRNDLIRIISGNLRARATTIQETHIKESLSRLQNTRIRLSFSHDGNVYDLEGCLAYTEDPGTAFVLLRYAEIVGGVLKLPAGALETQGRFSDTELSDLVKRYVIREVCLAGKDIFHIRLYQEQGKSGLYEEIGYRKEQEQRDPYFCTRVKPQIRRFATGTLDLLQQRGIIDGYQPYREPGTAAIAGYKAKTEQKQKGGFFQW